MERNAYEYYSNMQIKNGDYNLVMFSFNLYDGDRDVEEVSMFNQIPQPIYTGHS